MYLRGRCGLFFPSLTLLVSISLHLSAVYLLPSLIYLHLVNSQKEKKQFNLKKIFNVVFLLLLIGVGFVILSHKNPNPTSVTAYLIPLAGGENDPYSLFSGAHLVDMINEQLLLSPAGIILLAVVIFFAGKINFKDKVITFLVIVTLFSFLFAFLMDPDLGYARDWDLFSSTGLGYTLLGIYLGFNYFRHPEIKKLNYIVLALASYGHEILALYYRDRRLVNEEMEEWKKAVSVVENERYVGNLGICYAKVGRYQEAIAMFKKQIQMNPNSAKAYNNLGMALSGVGEYEESQKQYEMSIKVDPYYFKAYSNLGGLLTQMGRYQEALKALKVAIQINPNYFEAHGNLALLYNRLGKPKEVIPFFQAYLKRNPKDYQRVQQLLEKMNIDLD
ncbi:MAG: hypothetical protein AMJ89_05980 [candidate division Zixibacteria bacterium SM23_73]|nr:MAG: hypothetical protein AMJ89_05980 [candidate division Zixibacteria bacterium SM23_73]